MKKLWKISICFLLVCLLSLSLFGLTCTAATAEQAPKPITSIQVTALAEQLYPNDWQNFVDMPYRVVFFINTPNQYNPDGFFLLFGFASTTDFKFSEGKLWKDNSQQYISICFTGSYNQYATSTYKYNFMRGGQPNFDTWSDYPNYSGVKYWNYQFPSSFVYVSPDINSLPAYNYNNVNSVWEYVIPPSTDAKFYEKPTDTDPISELTIFDWNGSFNGGSWVDNNGVVHGGGGGSFSDPQTVNWSNFSGFLDSFHGALNASSSNAEPITITMFNHNYTILDPEFFESDTWSICRYVLQAGVIFGFVCFIIKLVKWTVGGGANE